MMTIAMLLLLMMLIRSTRANIVFAFVFFGNYMNTRLQECCKLKYIRT